MRNPPLIGLTGRRKTGHEIKGTPAPLRFMEIETYYSAYARGVVSAGGLPVHLSMDADPELCAQRLDGLLLSGGTDVDPGRYGQEPESHRYQFEAGRDRFELGLVDAAVAAGTPLLGICRGHQLLNVHGGGTLHQHVPEHDRFDRPPAEAVHRVVMEAGSVLADLYGPTHLVNSLHHQVPDEVAPDYRVTARSDDGAVEGLEHRSRAILSVQWHPEMMDGRSEDPVFAWIVKQACDHRAGNVA